MKHFIIVEAKSKEVVYQGKVKDNIPLIYVLRVYQNKVGETTKRYKIKRIKLLEEETL